jgi:hypothetical protein
MFYIYIYIVRPSIKTDSIAFIGNVIMHITSHWPIIYKSIRWKKFFYKILDNRLCLYKSSPTTRWNNLNTIYIRHRSIYSSCIHAYRIMAVLKVETDIITSSIGWAAMLVIMFVVTIKTHSITFIGNVIMRITSHWPIVNSMIMIISVDKIKEKNLQNYW